ncbi:MAG: BMC domain-containing protein [Lachnospiraceae bacterium]|nr:BMC domain-containing protein [Lachnospiraceae bacterium]
MSKKCVGFIEAIGMAAAIQAADTAVKSANVKLLGYEYSGGKAQIVVKIEGNVGAVKAAIAAAKIAVDGVKGSLSGYDAILEKPALNEEVYDTLVHNAQTVGDELQIQSGKRPQGTGRQAKWVGKWDQHTPIRE